MIARHEALSPQRDEDERRAAAFLGSLQLADSFFPGGGYTLSHGLESYAEAGLLDVASLTAIAADLIRHSVGPSDAVALAITMRSAESGDLDTIAAVDERLTAVKVAREPRQASIRLGRQILAIARDTFEDDVARTYLERVRAENLPGNQAVAMGVLKHALDIPVREAVTGELYAFATTCAGAALRMSLIDHRQAQRVIRDLAPAIISATEDALVRTLPEIGGSTPFAELMAMRHETAEIRLFVT